MTGPQRRASERIPTDLAAVVGRDDEHTMVRLSNLSAGGGFVEFPASPALPGVGTGIQVEIRLPIGFWLNANCVVRWIRRTPSAEGPIGCGVEFVSIPAASRQLLESFLNDPASKEETLDARLSDKYHIEIDKGGFLVLDIVGALDQAESASLKQEVLRQMKDKTDKPLNAFINARSFKASRVKALDNLTEMFAALGSHGLAFAVMVEPPTVPGTQLRRAIRNAGVADNVICFENESSASAFWQEAMTTLRV